MKNHTIETELNDFYLSPNGGESAHSYYQSFKKSLESYAVIKKVVKKQELDASFYRFFKETHLSQGRNNALFRRSAVASEALTLLWLGRCKAIASLFFEMNTVPEFTGLSKEKLIEISKLSTDPAMLPKLENILLDLGIILLFEESIPGMKLDGAVFKLYAPQPVIALSLRNPRLDIFWFTLMHELAHVALHYDQLDIPIIDDFDEGSNEVIELQANKLASESLISRTHWRSCKALYDQSDAAVISFAAEAGVHPSIVAGRVRRDLNRHDLFSKIINEFNVREVLR
jgi:HTH-type transcriptional regulator/antitoxin HigA